MKTQIIASLFAVAFATNAMAVSDAGHRKTIKIDEAGVVTVVKGDALTAKQAATQGLIRSAYATACADRGGMLVEDPSINPEVTDPTALRLSCALPAELNKAVAWVTDKGFCVRPVGGTDLCWEDWQLAGVLASSTKTEGACNEDSD